MAIHEYTDFESLFLTVLNNHAPLEKKRIRVNHTPYRAKPLRKAIIKRSYLKRLI